MSLDFSLYLTLSTDYHILRVSSPLTFSNPSSILPSSHCYPAHLKCIFSCLDEYNSLLTGLLVSRLAPVHSAFSRASGMIHIKHKSDPVSFREALPGLPGIYRRKSHFLSWHAASVASLSRAPHALALATWTPAAASLTGSCSLHSSLCSLLLLFKLNVLPRSVTLVL